MERSAAYTLRFAALIAVVASILVAGSAVALRGRQESNRLLDRRRTVLQVAGLVVAGERLARAEVTRRFDEHVRAVPIELASGASAPEIDAASFDQRRAARDPSRSRVAPENRAGIARLPHAAIVYHVVENGGVRVLVLPVEGTGLWSTMYGYLALSGDLSTVRGLTFYEHGETAGLGAQVSDPSWLRLWEGRRAFDQDWNLRLEVIKGPARPSHESPYQVDGIAGATLTGRGVTRALHFWLGEDGYGPYLERYRREGGIP